MLKTVYAAKSYKEWITQANNAHNMIDRYDAVYALRDSSINQKRDDLITIFNKEKYHAIRSEIVYQLKKDLENTNTITLMKKAVRDSSFNVRRAVVDYIDTIPKNLLADCETLLTDTSYITIENALRKLAKQYPHHQKRYFDIVKNTIGMFKNVRIAMLELKSNGHTDKATQELNELIDYTSHSYEFMTRTRAMAALERLKFGNETLIKNLFDAILNPNSRLANPAIKTLKALMREDKVKEEAQAYYKATVWKDWQQDILKNVFEKSAK